MNFGGIKIVESQLCVQKVWNFKPSENRSRRLHKKLIKRHGCQSYEKPGAYIVSGQLVAHPDIIKQMIADNRIIGVSS